jgi:hypothetical protein
MGSLGTLGSTGIWLAVLLGVASSGLAQGIGEQPVTLLPSRVIPVGTEPLPPVVDYRAPEREAELKRWMEEFTDWQKWSAEWSNRRQPGLFTGFRDRPEKPTPPAWLAPRCETVIDETDPLIPACVLLAEWNEDRVAAQMRQARTAVVAKKEDTSRSIWWEHIHMDVLWPATQWNAGVYGVVGMHTATTIRGRLQIFLAPGAMLLNVPARNGSRVWKLATNYGFGYRLVDFTLPGGRDAVLHLNLAKAWVISDVSDAVTSRSMDFAGFSITFKKRG